jgi:hypothetical protein
MRRLGKPWEIMYGIGILIFVGGWFLNVERSPYFPYFVVFLMAFGAVTTALIMRPDRQAPKE